MNGLALRGETWRNADGGKSGFVFFTGDLVHVFFMCDRELTTTYRIYFSQVMFPLMLP